MDTRSRVIYLLFQLRYLILKLLAHANKQYVKIIVGCLTLKQETLLLRGLIWENISMVLFVVNYWGKLDR